MTAEAVIARRRSERKRLVEPARRFVGGRSGADVRAAVVFGSVARGDFNERSDIDVLVVAGTLPADPLARLPVLGVDLPPCVSVVAWTPREWRHQRRRGNPVALEAEQHGSGSSRQPTRSTAELLPADPAAGCQPRIARSWLRS